MNYELLSSLYYKGKKEYEQEYNDRFNSVASKRLNISIEENQCFYIDKTMFIKEWWEN